jgi:hypothetical protein
VRLICEGLELCEHHQHYPEERGGPCPGMCDGPECRAVGVWEISDAPIDPPWSEGPYRDWPLRLCTLHVMEFERHARRLGK